MVMHGGLTRVREEAKTGGNGDTTSQLLACPIVHDWEGYFGRLPAVGGYQSKVAHGAIGYQRPLLIPIFQGLLSNFYFGERVQGFFFQCA